MSHTITTSALSVALNGRVVVDDVSVCLSSGGIVALVGPNGAGKSTLLRALAGLVPLAHGTFAVDGRPHFGYETERRARLIAYLPQERTVAWPMPARAIVALGRMPHAFGLQHETEADRAVIDAALAAVDATAFASRPVLELSGGERARVLIARALAQKPGILLADEPAAGLDPAHQWSLFQHLGRIAADGVLVVVALHDLALAAQFSTHVIVFNKGRVVADGAPERALTPQILAGVYGIESEIRDIAGRRVLVQTGLSPQPPS
jgi:iron complex transport system ATP-binding protein